LIIYCEVLKMVISLE